MTTVALLILGTLLYELYGVSLLAPKTYVYLYVPDGSGLTSDSPVRVDGIDVGKVMEVRLSGSREPSRVVRVTLSIERDRLRSIPADSVSQLSSDSLVGDKFVDITSGTSSSPLRPDGEITYKNQPELLRSLDLTQFTQQLRLVDATLADMEEGRSEFGKFFQGQEFYNNLSKRLRELQTAIREAVGTSSLVGQLLNSDHLYRQFSDFISGLDQAIAKLQAGQGPGGQLLTNPAQYDQLLATTRQLHQSVNQLASSDLLQSDRAYVNAGQLLAALSANLDELNRNPLLTNTSTYEALNGSVDEIRKTLRDFRTNPRKYLRLKVF